MRNRTYRAAASANLADGFAALGVRGALVLLFVREVLHRSAVWTGIAFLLFAVLNGAALVPGGFLVDSASYGSAFGLAAVVLGAAAVLGFVSPETRGSRSTRRKNNEYR